MVRLAGKIKMEMKQLIELLVWCERDNLNTSKDAIRRIQNASNLWYTIVSELHRFFIAVARTVVNNDGKGGTAPVWWISNQNKPEPMVRLETWPGFVAALHLGTEDGKCGHTSFSPSMMLEVGRNLSA